MIGFRLTIETENAIFDDGAEVEIVRILRVMARNIKELGLIHPLPIYDRNGNRVGDAILELEAEDNR